MIILGCFGGTTIYGNTHMMPWRTTLCLASAAVWVTRLPCSDFSACQKKPPWKSQQWWNTSGAMEEWQPNDLRWRKMNRFGCLMFECTAHPVDSSEILRSPVDTENVSHCLQGIMHPRLCRISSINSSKNPAHTQFHSSYCSSRWNKYACF